MSNPVVRLSEVISALTYALDLTEGQRPGHTLRTAIIAMRLGGEAGLSAEEMHALYFASLLKDSGCSSNAARMAALFGSDDQVVKREMRLVDWHDRFRLALRTARNCGIGGNPFERIRHFLAVARTPDMTRSIIQARCERGAQIARELGFPAATSEAIQYVDEHWCGLGHPVGLAGDAIPVLSRILLLSQTLEAYMTEQGVRDALQMVRARRGTWFDPALADRVQRWSSDHAWWNRLSDSNYVEAEVLRLEPTAQPLLASEGRLDDIARGFAAVIDAKTPFTFRHSANVANYAVAIGRSMGYATYQQRQLLRAGLLHDIGKLGISNRILDKPSALTDAERRSMRNHPLWTLEILERVPAFAGIAASAARHHERLDGNGYPWGVGGAALDQGARILAVADVYEALTADRPYRAGMEPRKALDIMRREVGTAFDAASFEVLESIHQDTSDSVSGVSSQAA